MDLTPYPAPVHRPPEPPERSRLLMALIVVAGLVLAVAALSATGYGLLRAVDPMGDEWICSDGETPAGQDGFYHQCFLDTATLPAGYEWDPYGNRPMPYNCDKDGWVHVERPDGHGQAVEDCVSEDVDVPDDWTLLD